MRKKIAPVMVAGLVSLGLGIPVHGEIETGQLTIWVNGDRGYRGLTAIARGFTDKTGIKVKVAHPNQMEVRFQNLATTGNGPDIIFWAHDRFGEWAKAGLIVPVTPSAEEKAKFEALAWEAMAVDGRYYGYPVSIDTISLIYNKRLLPSPPATFEEMAALDDQLQLQGKRAIMWAYNVPFFTYPLLAANGGYAFKKTGSGYDVRDTGINNQGAKLGLKFVVRMQADGHLDKKIDYARIEDDFCHGRLAMTINGPWAWTKLDACGVDYGVAPLPSLNGQPAKPFVGVWGAAINAASPNRTLVVDFLENYLLTDEGLARLNADKALGVVAFKSFQQRQEQDERVQASMLSARNGEPMPSVPEMIRFWDAFDTALEQVTTGKETVEAALDKAAMRIAR